ncbi:MAG: Hpt domain-containing protein [Gammaproteobacteria bacterium]|nr:Hpt domain-containing protein [Gammaproteobacteria bacterium]
MTKGIKGILLVQDMAVSLGLDVNMLMMSESQTILLDQAKLNQLRNWQGRLNPELFQKVVRLYIEQMTGLLKQLLQHAGQGNHEMVTGIAHTLKSSSGTVGATNLMLLCEKIESYGEQGKIDMDLILSVQDACNAVEVALKKELEMLV